MENSFEIVVYERANGDKPLEIFLSTLEVKMKAKVFREIAISKQNGNELREPQSKHIKDNLYELRIKYGSDISRIMYFFVSGRKIILTHGFIKKRQGHREKRLYGLRNIMMIT